MLLFLAAGEKKNTKQGVKRCISQLSAPLKEYFLKIPDNTFHEHVIYQAQLVENNL